jgi:hypothetical protein
MRANPTTDYQHLTTCIERQRSNRLLPFLHRNYYFFFLMFLKSNKKKYHTKPHNILIFHVILNFEEINALACSLLYV